MPDFETDMNDDTGDQALLISGSAETGESPPAIQVDQVSKKYHLYRRPSDRLKQMLGGWRRNYYSEFAALKDISFQVDRGETVGIVGRNGSGKSTLLQVICGTVAASSGSINVDGRIAALLELGAGFNPEFSGRENVYLNGSLLGLSRDDMDERFESIAAFADIGEFIDHPVKTYSSGMYVRLAFATAINADPDILVIDEALSVGDEAFRRKCFARIEQIKNSGATILFVSHSASSILQLCSRAILLDQGEKLLEGSPKLVINQYQRLINLEGEEAKAARADIIESAKKPAESTARKAASPASLQEYDPHLKSQSTVIYEQNGAEISGLQILNETGQLVNTLHKGRRYTYRFEAKFDEDFESVAFGMLIKTVKGIDIIGASTRGDANLQLRAVKAGMVAEATFDFVCNLRPSLYAVNAGVSDPSSPDGGFIHRILDGLVFRVAPTEDNTSTGIVDTGVMPSARITFTTAEN